MVPLHEDLDCNWSNASDACGGYPLGIPGCFLTCHLTGVPESECEACKKQQDDLWKKCKNSINCHCPAGTTYCKAANTLLPTDCCDPAEQCTLSGCVPPCTGCDERNLFAQCRSTCITGKQTCCGKINDETCCGPAPLTCCNDECVNVNFNNENCGGCDSPCPPGDSCQNGKCSACCVPGQICGSLPCCPGNAGACGQTCCPAGQGCCPGLGCIPAGYSCCTGNEGQIFGCEYGCCGDGCLPAPDYVCCSLAQTANCPAGECCLDMSTGKWSCCPPPSAERSDVFPQGLGAPVGL